MSDDDSASAMTDALPIHFFTIVLNGEPFIEYHEKVFSRLPFAWHWHIVEGVARLTNDTAWSVATGGSIAAVKHCDGLSSDGTSQYLDALKTRHPDRVSLYRKPPGEFWDGKREMCNAPLPKIAAKGLLWQVDSDELWTPTQIAAVRTLFLQQPTKSAAYFWCHYFVGPRKVITTRNAYAQNPAVEWLRVWRFEPGDVWAAHEPPILTRRKRRFWRKPQAIDIAKIDPFLHADTEAADAVFQHFSYVTEEQLTFKEHYFGYKDALQDWRRLQAHGGAGRLADYMAWVTDEAAFDDVAPQLELLATPSADGWALHP